MDVLGSIHAFLFGKTIASAREGNDTIAVVERGSSRVFMCNDVVLSRLDSRLYTGGYWDYFSPLPSLYKDARVLVIGLGGGTVPYQLESIYGSSARIDVVEISETVSRLSKAFLPRQLRSRVIISDGTEFVKGLAPDSYDIIILDPYRTYALARAFMEGSFIEAAYTALSQEGILAINYIIDSSNASLWEEALSLLKGRFSMYSIAAPPASGNRVVLCSKKLGSKEMLARIAAHFPGGAMPKHVADGYSAMEQLP